MKKSNKQDTSHSSKSAKAPAAVAKEVGAEPSVGLAAMPVLLIAVLSALMYLGSMHIMENGGELDARVQGPFKNWKEIEGYKPQDESAKLAAQGARVYNQFCVACHQNDGNGSASQNAPPLAGSEWVLEKDPSRIIRIVLNGLGGPITVKGKEYGQAQMTPWRDALKDEDVAAVLTYVRNAWGNKAPVVDAAQVKLIRDLTADHGGAWTAEELNKVPLKN